MCHRIDLSDVVSVLDVARYILNKKQFKKGISRSKLNKLFYYAQAWHIVWEGKILFEEEIEASELGPICHDFNDLCETFGRTIKKKHLKKMKNKKRLTNSEKTTVDSIVDYYGDKSNEWLRSLVTKEDPWNEARKTTITHNSMLNYYQSL